MIAQDTTPASAAVVIAGPPTASASRLPVAGGNLFGAGTAPEEGEAGQLQTNSSNLPAGLPPAGRHNVSPSVTTLETPSSSHIPDPALASIFHPPRLP
jgi:hypothetical protein